MDKKQSSPKIVSTETYKGVRDFYPEEMRLEKYIWETMRKSAESFGYVEYGASILESSELYEVKSGEEIVNEQTYTFEDRGGRSVTLRPEMTPTVARMVAKKAKSLGFPLRWYSIPNLFRYEQPQRGRLREHFQLNVDIFGVEDLSAEVEIISLATETMRNFGAKPEDFIVRINNRAIISELFKAYEIEGEASHALSKLIDKKNKITETVFENALEELIGPKSKEFKAVLNSNREVIKVVGSQNKSVTDLLDVMESLHSLGIVNIVFDPTLMRGFDYYTGIVFEIFDTNPENPRSLFGGGRYDDLLEMFGSKKVPGCGFGMGDVTAKDFIEGHKLLPKLDPEIECAVLRPDKTKVTEAMRVANILRNGNIKTSVDLSNKKIGEQIKSALKQGAHFAVFVGEQEIKKREFTVKNLLKNKEEKVKEADLVSFFLSQKA